MGQHSISIGQDYLPSLKRYADSFETLEKFPLSKFHLWDNLKMSYFKRIGDHGVF